jgi:hypothetical protein
MVQGPSLSRVPPKRVPAIERDGVRYDQVMDVADIDNRTGWLRATRIDSGEVIWTKQVYRHELDPRMERDVQEVYFRSLAFDPARNAIVVENERGERFHVDPVSGESAPAD